MSANASVVGKRLGVLGAWFALCVACGSTVANPSTSVKADGGQGGMTLTNVAGAAGKAVHGDAGGSNPQPQGGTSGAPNTATSGSAMGGESTEPGGAGGAGGSTTEPTCRPALPVIYRDFRPYGVEAGHDDFEMSARGVHNGDGSIYQGWNEIGCGLIEPVLGVDGKPRLFTGPADVMDGLALPGFVGRQQRVISGPGCFTPANATPTGDCNVGVCSQWHIIPPTYSIKSSSTFDQWYNTVPGVNAELRGELVLTKSAASPDMWAYDSDAFFPIDGAGFGNPEGLAHNYSFTTEAHVTFVYEPGQRFTFKGDDDVWIFVNGKLALDMGGQHQPLKGVIDLDAQAATLGITPGTTYRLDLFHAERQSTTSTFHLATNIACFEPG